MWFNAPGGRTSTLRPDNVGTTRATLSFMSEPRGYDRWDGAGQRDVLRRRFAGVGWEVPRILDAMRTADDVYFDTISQVQARAGPPGGPRCSVTRPTARHRSAGRAPAWRSPGRTCWPASWPPGGDHASRSPRTSGRMRGFVERNQRIARHRWRHPDPEEHGLGLWLRDRIISALPRLGPAKSLVTGGAERATRSLDLRDYAHDDPREIQRSALPRAENRISQ